MFRKKKKGQQQEPALDVEKALGIQDGARSPLEGQTLSNILLKIAIAIAVPGGLYVLAALVIVPLIIRFIMRRADQQAAQGDLDQAVAGAGLAVKLSRGSASVRTRRAVLLLERGDLDGALADAAAALEKPSAPPLAYYVRGAVADVRGDAAAALADYVEFLERHTGPADRRTLHARERIAALDGSRAVSHSR